MHGSSTLVYARGGYRVVRTDAGREAASHHYVATDTAGTPLRMACDSDELRAWVDARCDDGIASPVPPVARRPRR